MKPSPPLTRILGYARSSSSGQTLDAQLALLRAERCDPIYRERSGPNRPTLQRLLSEVAPGDVVTVTRIDRVARSNSGPVRHRRKDCGGRCPVPLAGRALGRHIKTNRPVDAFSDGWSGRAGARPDPHPHVGRPQPSTGAGPADGATTGADAAAAGRSAEAPGQRRHTAGAGGAVQRQPRDDFAAGSLTVGTSLVSPTSRPRTHRR